MDSRCANSFVGRSLAGGLKGSTNHHSSGSLRSFKDTVKSQGTADRWDRSLLGTAYLC